MKKKLPLFIIILSIVEIGMFLGYFIKLEDYSFSNNLGVYALLISGVSFLALGFNLRNQKKVP